MIFLFRGNLFYLPQFFKKLFKMKQVRVVRIFAMLCCISTSSTIAQTSSTAEDVKWSYVGFSFGSAIPVGMYASTDKTNKESGYAKPGSSFAVNVNALFKGSRMGFAGMVAYFTNPFDVATMEQQLESDVDNTGYTFNISASDWKSTCMMMGLCSSFPAGKLSVNLRLLAGLASSTTPSFYARIVNTSTGGWFDESQYSVSDDSFCYNGGFSLCYKLTKRFSLMATADYLASKQKFAYPYGMYTIVIPQPMNVLNFTGGMAYMFR
jgi:hypothetical protein